MNIEEIREYCLSKKGAIECLPFNDTALVFKVMDKMFALLDLSEDSKGITLKCDPELALEQREQYPEVTPAYHFNKRHWNTVELGGTIRESMIYGWIDHSYNLVVQSLSGKKSKELNSL
jgi:predicted DNA-binding protein (MmcQ/YjbR family)